MDIEISNVIPTDCPIDHDNCCECEFCRSVYTDLYGNLMIHCLYKEEK